MAVESSLIEARIKLKPESLNGGVEDKIPGGWQNVNFLNEKTSTTAFKIRGVVRYSIKT